MAEEIKTAETATDDADGFADSHGALNFESSDDAHGVGDSHGTDDAHSSLNFESSDGTSASASAAVNVCVSEMEGNPASPDDKRLWNKAFWLVHSYLDQLSVCEQCKVELASMPKITWQDAFDSLSSHGDPFSERVQSSNISDTTYKIAVNIDEKMERMEEEQRREPERRLRAAETNVDVMDAVFVRLRILESEKEYRDTYSFADQFCRKGLRLTEVKDHNGRRMSRYVANREKKKVVELIVEELKMRERAKQKDNGRGA